jgi:hypothetical protein
MSRKDIRLYAAEPSFFYLAMAGSCFHRATSTRHRKGCGTLRAMGRNYLTKACGPTSALAVRSSMARPASAS